MCKETSNLIYCFCSASTDKKKRFMAPIPYIMTCRKIMTEYIRIRGTMTYIFDGINNKMTYTFEEINTKMAYIFEEINTKMTCIFD